MAEAAKKSTPKSTYNYSRAYLDTILETVKEHVPISLYNEIHKKAIPSAGGKARWRSGSRDKDAPEYSREFVHAFLEHTKKILTENHFTPIWEKIRDTAIPRSGGRSRGQRIKEKRKADDTLQKTTLENMIPEKLSKLPDKELLQAWLRLHQWYNNAKHRRSAIEPYVNAASFVAREMRQRGFKPSKESPLGKVAVGRAEARKLRDRKAKKPFEEIGSTGLRQFGGIIDEEFLGHEHKDGSDDGSLRHKHKEDTEKGAQEGSIFGATQQPPRQMDELNELLNKQSDAVEPSDTQTIKSQFGGQPEELSGAHVNLPDILSKVALKRDHIIIPDFVSIVGSSVSKKKKDPHDIDILFRADLDDDKKHYLINAENIGIVTRKAIDPDKEHDLHYIGNPQGSHGDYVPLYDLVLRKKKELVKKVVKSELGDSGDYLAITKTSKLTPGKHFSPEKPSMAGVTDFFETSKLWDDWAAAKIEEGAKLIGEVKFDGFRTLLSKSGDHVTVWFEDAEQNRARALPQIVDALKKSPFDSIILDGEMLARHNGKIVPRVQMMELLSKQSFSFDPYLFVFDCLYLNGEDLSEKPLSERMDAMRSVVKRLPSKFFVASISKPIHDKASLQSVGKWAASQFGSEGVMVKDVRKPYTFGSSDDWAKYKTTFEIKVEVHKVNKTSNGYTYDCGLIAKSGSPYTNKIDYNGKELVNLGGTFVTKEQVGHEGDTLNVRIEELIVLRNPANEDMLSLAWGKPTVVGPDKSRPAFTDHQAVQMARSAHILKETIKKIDIDSYYGSQPIVTFVADSPRGFETALNKPMAGLAKIFKEHYLTPLGLSDGDYAMTYLVPLALTDADILLYNQSSGDDDIAHAQLPLEAPSRREPTAYEIDSWLHHAMGELQLTGSDFTVALDDSVYKALGDSADFILPHPSHLEGADHIIRKTIDNLTFDAIASLNTYNTNFLADRSSIPKDFEFELAHEIIREYAALMRSGDYRYVPKHVRAFGITHNEHAVMEYDVTKHEFNLGVNYRTQASYNAFYKKCKATEDGDMKNVQGHFPRSRVVKITADHEIGHSVYYNLPIEEREQYHELYKRYQKSGDIGKVSIRATVDNKEGFAEMYAAYINGKEGLLPDEIRKQFDHLRLVYNKGKELGKQLAPIKRAIAKVQYERRQAEEVRKAGPPSEDETRAEVSDKFWKAHWQEAVSKPGHGRYVLHEHWRGLSEDETKESRDQLIDSDHSVHSDLRLESSGEHYLHGWTLFLGKARDNKQNRFLTLPPEDSLQASPKQPEPLNWINYHGLSEPSGVGATSNKWARFDIADHGTYHIGVAREHMMEYFLDSAKERKRVRVVFNFAPMGGKRIWLCTKPKDQTPYAETHDKDDVIAELKSKGQKWLVWCTGDPEGTPDLIDVTKYKIEKERSDGQLTYDRLLNDYARFHDNKEQDKDKKHLTKSQVLSFANDDNLNAVELLVDLIVPVQKAADAKEKQVVCGVIFEPYVPDAQHDWITPEELEEAAHNFLIKAREAGERHSKHADAEVAESYIAPSDMTIGGQKVIKGSWVVCMKVNSKELWAKVRSGEYKSFSMGGSSKRIPRPVPQEQERKAEVEKIPAFTP